MMDIGRFTTFCQLGSGRDSECYNTLVASALRCMEWQSKTFNFLSIETSAIILLPLSLQVNMACGSNLKQPTA